MKNIDKNQLLDLFSSSMENSEYKFMEFAESNDIQNYSTIIEEFKAIQDQIYNYILEITEPNIQLSATEIEKASIQYCKKTYTWINETGIKAINRWLIWMCWHEGILKQ